ncbi:MAG: methylated-DNA--[protein]-cysteine S-methyltransferase [Oscillospiraceae bacterium]|nr:methylated-DNA--[protein]-cysteine S-methyltransferase [Oscillospiraceae bacterium]
MIFNIIDSPCGPLTAVSDGEALCRLSFGAVSEDAARGRDKVIEELERQLAEYFAGERKTFELPVKLYGSVFEQCVWAGLGSIPYGKTVTYGELAAAVGKPSAARAAGGACGRNPVSIVVPCHRVVGAGRGGSRQGTAPWRERMTGFGGGLANKALLLELEERHNA